MYSINTAKAQSLIINLSVAIADDIKRIFKLVAVIVVLILLDLVALKSYLRDVNIGYVAIENNGAEMKLKRLKETPYPELTIEKEKKRIVSNVKSCLEQFFKTDTQNYLADMQEASSCFSMNTYHSFTQTLIDSGYIGLLKNGEIWNAYMNEAKTTVKRFEKEGRLTWMLEIPFLLKRKTNEGNKLMDINMSVRVSRMNSLEFKDSIAITQVVIKND